MHVIMVEDETMVARRLARCVESVLGASLQRLEIFGDLRSAEAHLQATVPDVLLLDLNLHGRDGFDLLTRAVSGSPDERRLGKGCVSQCNSRWSSVHEKK